MSNAIQAINPADLSLIVDKTGYLNFIITIQLINFQSFQYFLKIHQLHLPFLIIGAMMLVPRTFQTTVMVQTEL